MEMIVPKTHSLDTKFLVSSALKFLTNKPELKLVY